MSKYTLDLHLIKLFLKNFLGRACPQIPSSKIDQRYTHRTTTQAECITMPLHYFKNYTPIFEL